MRISQEAYDIHLKSLQDGFTRYERSLRQAQQTSNFEEGNGNLIGMQSDQQSVPSTFFEDVLKQLNETVIQLKDKIENSYSMKLK